jgi:PAS domain S-box-containing protein
MKVQELFRESEERFRRLVENAPIAMSIINIDGTVEYTNERHVKVTGYNGEDTLTLEQWWASVYPDEEYRKDIVSKWNAYIYKSSRGEGIGTQERQIVCKDGTIKDIELQFTRVGDKVIVVFNDITERKSAEEKIITSLNEKEVLLKEIHHRVKNNMQVISSLIDLESLQFKDTCPPEIFVAIKNRIRSMSLIHEKIYMSKDMSRINLADYIGSLANGLLVFYGITSSRITLNIDAEDDRLDIDVAAPCGLIINELVSNSLKYAFPEGRTGEINIAIRKNKSEVDGDNEYELMVSDNGVGMPESINFRKTESLGLQLVTTLAEHQLQGKIELNRANGTEFHICFKKLNKKSRT